jgi:DNA-binding PadR family transcriptional regulator
MGNDTSPVELLQGTADLLILRTLVFGPSHGHAIPSRPRHLAGRAAGRDRLALPPLDRLEAQGWVISVWQPSDKGKRAKYYCHRTFKCGH